MDRNLRRLRVLHWILLFLAILGVGVYVYAQNPVSISQVGTTPVTTTIPVSGTFWQATQPVSGTFWQATQPISVVDGGDVTLGAKADAKSTATDTTAISIMSVLKEISAMEQAPASRAVTNGGTFAVQAAESGTWTVQPGNTANSTPWLVTGSGSAGSAASGVLTVQGIAAMTKLLVTPDSVALPANQSMNLAQLNAHTTLEGGTNGSLAVGGTVATNVAITANPLNFGAQAVSAENTAVTTARQVQLVADLVGKLIVLPYANPENFVSGVTAAMTGTTSTSLLAVPAAGLRNYVTQLTCTNSHATVGTFILVQDGNGGTTLYEGYAASLGGGFSLTFPAPLRQPTTATAVYVQDVTTGANVICSGSGYKGA